MRISISPMFVHPLECSIQEKTELEQSWAKKVETVQKDAQKSKETTEKKVSGVIDRLHQLTEREAKREAQRGTQKLHLILSPRFQQVCKFWNFELCKIALKQGNKHYRLLLDHFTFEQKPCKLRQAPMLKQICKMFLIKVMLFYILVNFKEQLSLCLLIKCLR